MPVNFSIFRRKVLRRTFFADNKFGEKFFVEKLPANQKKTAKQIGKQKSAKVFSPKICLPKNCSTDFFLDENVSADSPDSTLTVRPNGRTDVIGISVS